MVGFGLSRVGAALKLSEVVGFGLGRVSAGHHWSITGLYRLLGFCGDRVCS